MPGVQPQAVASRVASLDEPPLSRLHCIVPESCVCCRQIIDLLPEYNAFAVFQTHLVLALEVGKS